MGFDTIEINLVLTTLHQVTCKNNPLKSDSFDISIFDTMISQWCYYHSPPAKQKKLRKHDFCFTLRGQNSIKNNNKLGQRQSQTPFLSAFRVQKDFDLSDLTNPN